MFKKIWFLLFLVGIISCCGKNKSKDKRINYFLNKRYRIEAQKINFRDNRYKKLFFMDKKYKKLFFF
jgi:hypothetical protein